MVYLDESSVCLSARHAGFVDEKLGGNFIKLGKFEMIIANG